MRRRVFLFVAAAGAALSGAVGLRRFGRSGRVLPDEPPGTLADNVFATLLALPEALVDHEVESDHYETFYRFRAEKLPGYAAVYVRFTEEVDAQAERLLGKRFRAASPAERRRILDSLPISRDTRRKTGWSLDPWPARFQQFVVNETLELYNRTDAWVALGYGAWPGRPRTLALMEASPADLAAQAELKP